MSDVFEVVLYTEKMKSVADNFRRELKESKRRAVLFFERSWAFAYGTLFSLTGLYYKARATLRLAKYDKLPSLKQDSVAYVLLNNAVYLADKWTEKFDTKDLKVILQEKAKYGKDSELQKEMERAFPWLEISLEKPRSRFKFITVKINETALSKGVKTVISMQDIKENPKIDSLKRRLFAYKSGISKLSDEALIQRYIKLRFLGSVADSLVDRILARSSAAKNLFNIKINLEV